MRENKKSERFANLFAANILMPKEYFSLKFYKYKEEILGNGKFSKNSRKALFSIIYKLKNEFSCSVAAIAWRLFELRLITKNMFKILDIK